MPPSRSELPFAPVAVDEGGNTTVCCEQCGSTNLDFDGWDIDKCPDWRRDGGRWYVNDEPGVPGWGPYWLPEIRGFLDGCRAMGANI